MSVLGPPPGSRYISIFLSVQFWFHLFHQQRVMFFELTKAQHWHKIFLLYITKFPQFTAQGIQQPASVTHMKLPLNKSVSSETASVQTETLRWFDWSDNIPNTTILCCHSSWYYIKPYMWTGQSAGMKINLIKELAVNSKWFRCWLYHSLSHTKDADLNILKSYIINRPGVDR